MKKTLSILALLLTFGQGAWAQQTTPSTVSNTQSPEAVTVV